MSRSTGCRSRRCRCKHGRMRTAGERRLQLLRAQLALEDLELASETLRAGRLRSMSRLLLMLRAAHPLWRVAHGGVIVILQSWQASVSGLPNASYGQGSARHPRVGRGVARLHVLLCGLMRRRTDDNLERGTCSCR